ncbi:MAG: SDR family NAD(P)-dependent oxidoreductase [Acidimicrobiia bacterium]|nr:SDR family NAD(P)-dependent oxidoreductase [Acidimicrobiia bacterium]
MTEWNIRGKQVLITGASAGIGKATALELAARGATLTLAGRSLGKTETVIRQIETESGTADFLMVDLASPGSVRDAARTFLASGRPLDVLVNNAGVGGTKGVSAEGFEIAFATNHLGHHLLTRWLEPLLIDSAPARLVVVASSVHHNVKEVKWDRLQRRTSSVLGNPEYRVSKLANILDGRQWAHRLDGSGVDVHIVHPGLVASEIWRDLPRPLRMMFARQGQTIEEGADTSIWAASEPHLAGVSGRYYGKRSERTISNLAADNDLAQEMWDRTEGWLAQWLPPG